MLLEKNLRPSTPGSQSSSPIAILPTNQILVKNLILLFCHPPKHNMITSLTIVQPKWERKALVTIAYLNAKNLYRSFPQPNSGDEFKIYHAEPSPNLVYDALSYV